MYSMSEKELFNIGLVVCNVVYLVGITFLLFKCKKITAVQKVVWSAIALVVLCVANYLLLSLSIQTTASDEAWIPVMESETSALR